MNAHLLLEPAVLYNCNQVSKSHAILSLLRNVPLCAVTVALS